MKLNTEPVAVGAAIQAIAALLVIFNVVSLSAEQVSSIVLAYGTLAALVIRSKVTPNAKG